MAVSLITAADGQRRVETGVGTVSKIERKPGGRNAEVSIAAEHLRLPVKGWADTHDAGLMARLEGAMAARTPVEYRVETHRKAKIDPALPLDDVDKFDRVRDLIDVRPVGSPAASSTTATGGTASAARPAPAPDERPHDPDGDPGPTEPDGPAPSGSAARDERAETRTAPPASGARPGPSEPPPVAPPPARGPRIAEAKPWEPLNSDGSVNLGSYAVTASLSMVELAHDLLLERIRDLGGDEVEDLTLAQVRSLARRLLDAADGAQAAVRGDGRIDRMDASHTRARGAVRTALDLYPVPWGASEVDRTQWVTNLASHAGALIRLALDLDL